MKEKSTPRRITEPAAVPEYEVRHILGREANAWL